MSKSFARIVFALTAIFFAAFFVAYYHLAYWSWADDGGTTFRVARGAYQYPELAGTASLGWVGVEIFFVLSGIVIAMTSNGASAARFARSRFLRLWPALLFCSVISFAWRSRPVPTLPR